MKKNTLHFIVSFLAATVILASSCGDKKDDGENRISPEIVNNPASAGGDKESRGTPAFEFEETTFDFGTINSGDEITHVFPFTNSGDADLVIAQVKAACGCTQPEYPKDPVAPGEKGEIKVTFRSAGIAGQVAKTVTILANTTPSTKVLSLTGEVIKIKENNK